MRARGKHAGILALAALGLLPASSSHATLMVSSLDSTLNTSFNIESTGFIAARFTVGAQDVTLDSVTLSLKGERGVPFGDGTVTYNAFLNSDGSSQPGSQLASLGSWTRTDAGGPYQNHDFTDAGNTLLTSGTSYWVSVKTSSGDSGSWGAVSSVPIVTGEPGWSISQGGYNVLSFTSSTSTPRFAVNATVAVPEPASALLLAGGLGLLVSLRRRRVVR